MKQAAIGQACLVPGLGFPKDGEEMLFMEPGRFRWKERCARGARGGSHGLLALEHLTEHFKTQMSLRNRHKTVPQGVSDTGAWGFFRLRLILPPFIFGYAAFPLGRAGLGEDLESSLSLHVPSASVCDW